MHVALAVVAAEPVGQDGVLRGRGSLRVTNTQHAGTTRVIRMRACTRPRRCGGELASQRMPYVVAVLHSVLLLLDRLLVTRGHSVRGRPALLPLAALLGLGRLPGAGLRGNQADHAAPPVAS